VLPLDRFAVRDGTLQFVDLTPSAGGEGLPGRQYQVAWSEFNNGTGAHTPLNHAGFSIPRTAAAYLRAAITASDPNKGVHVYLRQTAAAWEVVGIERTW
jgi:hypothetical protein